MRKAVFFSAALHVAIVILAIVGLPSFLEDEPREIVPIAVQVVDASDLDKLLKPEPAKPKPPKPKPPEPPKSAPPEPPPAPTPPPPEKIDIPKPEPIPEKKPEPAPKPAAKPKPPPKPEEKPRPKPAAEAKPTPRPRHKPKPPPDQFESLLKNLAKERRQQEKQKAKEAPRKAVPAQTAERPAADKVSPLQRRMMLANLAQNIMRQVSPCWNIPAGAKDAADMRVAIRIRLNPDGKLGAPPQIEDASRMNSDLSFRTLAESALRALRDPSCTPLKLPYDQYDIWRDITFVFDPREALGQ